MIQIDVHSEIANPRECWCWWDDDFGVFGLDTIKKIVADNPKDNEIQLNFHCPGGSVDEGLAIYDYLRSSGKTIYTNIEGDCHSMAVTLLLAAPLENRSANPNCSALIHEVRSSAWSVTAEDAQKLSEEIKDAQNKILDIYADRTGRDKSELENLMKEEKVRNATWLKEYGFISKINSYNTNASEVNSLKNIIKKVQIMTKIGEKAQAFLNRMTGKTPEKKLLNYSFKDADGNELFHTDKEDDTIIVGDTASPDGTFTLASDTSEYKAGTVVVVEDGTVKTITPKEEETDKVNFAKLTYENEVLQKANEEAQEIINQLLSENNSLEAENISLKASLEEAKNVASSFQPKQRMATTQLPQKTEETVEDIKKRIRNNRKQKGE